MRCHWGILGPGLVATQAVMPAIQRVEEATIQAVASRDTGRLESRASKFGIPDRYQDYQALLDDPRIDAVYIALPNHLHHPWTIKALRAGKHVLCEKPLALNVREGEEMLAVSQETGKLLMEAAMYRFHPRMQHLKQMVERGELGELRFIHSTFCFTLEDPQTYRHRPEYGGGALLDVGPYCLNAVRWLIDREPEEISAQGYRDADTGIDMGVSALLCYPDHILAHIQCSFDAAEQQVLELVGSKATVSLPHQAFTAWKDDATTLIISHGQEVERKNFAPADPYEIMVRHFTTCVVEQRAAEYPISESLETLRLIDWIGKMVE